MILAWRDVLFKNIKLESHDLELPQEFSLSMDLFHTRMRVKPGLMNKLKLWVETKLVVIARQAKDLADGTNSSEPLSKKDGDVQWKFG